MKIKFDFSPVNLPDFVCRLLENGLLWMVLLLLTTGGIGMFYYEDQISQSDNGVGLNLVSVFSPQQAPPDGAAPYLVGKSYLPISGVETTEPVVALSFDVDMGCESVKILTDILDKRGVKATFFLTGDWVERFPGEVKALAAYGHELGNHTETHQYMSHLDGDEVIQELSGVHSRVKTITGSDMKLFRPSYGDFDDKVILDALSLGYYPILWDVDSEDWKDYGSENILSEVLNNPKLQNGSIIRFKSNSKYLPEALDSVITGLEAKGFRLVLVSQMIINDSFHINQNGRQVHN